MDRVRVWDVSGNDLNRSGDLDPLAKSLISPEARLRLL